MAVIIYMSHSPQCLQCRVDFEGFSQSHTSFSSNSISIKTVFKQHKNTKLYPLKQNVDHLSLSQQLFLYRSIPVSFNYNYCKFHTQADSTHSCCFGSVFLYVHNYCYFLYLPILYYIMTKHIRSLVTATTALPAL